MVALKVKHLLYSLEEALWINQAFADQNRSSMQNDDVFGKAFLAYVEDRDCEPISVWLDGEEQPPLDVGYFFRSYDEMPELEQRALQMCGPKTLDIGAAAGCHSRWLAQQELEVHSLEISPGACKVLRTSELPRILEGDFLSLEIDEKYDTLLFLMNGLGMGQDPEGTLRLLEKAKSLLNPGGQILGDTSDISYFREPETKKRGLTFQSSFDHYYGKVHFLTKWRSFKSSFNWIYPDPKLLETLAQQAGLRAEMIQEGPHYDYLYRFTIDGSQ